MPGPFCAMVSAISAPAPSQSLAWAADFPPSNGRAGQFQCVHATRGLPWKASITLTQWSSGSRFEVVSTPRVWQKRGVFQSSSTRWPWVCAASISSTGSATQRSPCVPQMMSIDLPLSFSTRHGPTGMLCLHPFPDSYGTGRVMRPRYVVMIKCAFLKSCSVRVDKSVCCAADVFHDVGCLRVSDPASCLQVGSSVRSRT
jgi:hypothetical protein